MTAGNASFKQSRGVNPANDIASKNEILSI